MKRTFSWIPVFVLLSVLCSAQEIKLPVFFLRYDGGVGSEEMATEEGEEEQLEPYSQRHKVTLRIKEQWGDGFATNLYTAVSWKRYFRENESDDYTYFYVNPDFVWDITDRVRWSSEFRSKWTWYDGLDSYGESKDLTSLLSKTELTLKVLDQLKLTPSFRSVFDLYRNADKIQQTYTAGLRVESRINPEVRLTCRYRGILRVPLGAESTISDRFNNEFGINLSWDPNK